MNPTRPSGTTRTTDLIIVGGGLAGLAAAALGVRAGRSVLVLEKARQAGGRGQSYDEGDFRFNLGPHALFRHGEGARLLRELGVSWTGKPPAARGTRALRGGRLELLPVGLGSFLRTRLLDWPSKLELARLLARLPWIDPAPFQSTPVVDWLEQTVSRQQVRDVLETLFRVSTYGNASGQLSAGAALKQLQVVLKGNVAYLDGGWRTLVEGLRRKAEESGARLQLGAPVEAVEQDGSVHGVRLADGTRIEAEEVILAVGPAEASALVEGGRHPQLRAWAQKAVPVRAASLNVALHRLPDPRNRVVLGVDQPLYLSVHSEWARLAPSGGATVDAMKYLAPGDNGLEALGELESLLDLAQPGWRDQVVARKWMPSLLVSNAMPLASEGGTAGRPGPLVPGVEGLAVAGDWVADRGLLADAALASARAAVQNLLARPQAVPV